MTTMECKAIYYNFKFNNTDPCSKNQSKPKLNRIHVAFEANYYNSECNTFYLFILFSS